VLLGSDESMRRDLAGAIAGRTLAPGLIPALRPGPAPDAGSSQAPPTPPPVDVAPAGDHPKVPTGSHKDIARNAAREAERDLIYRTLQQTRWNRREAAQILGVSYKALLYKIKEAELDKAS
jgi:DNA-binding NtrC family response regulator